MRASEVLGLGLVAFIASGIGAGVATRYWSQSSNNTPPPARAHHAQPGPTEGVIFIDDTDCSATSPVKESVNYAWSGQTLTLHVRSKCDTFNDAFALVSIQFVNQAPPLDPNDKSCTTAGCSGKLDKKGVLDLPITFAASAGGSYKYTITINGIKLADPDLEIDP